MYYTIEQRITAGGNFAGVTPGGTKTSIPGIQEKYAAHANGGLFLFPIPDSALVVSIELAMIGQTVWTISVKDVDTTTVVVWSGTTEDSFVTFLTDGFMLLAGQTLLISTTGATGALMARVTIEIDEDND